MSGRHLGKLIDRWSREDEVLPPGAYIGVTLHVAGQVLTSSLPTGSISPEPPPEDTQNTSQAPLRNIGHATITGYNFLNQDRSKSANASVDSALRNSLPTGSESTSSYGKTVAGPQNDPLIRHAISQGDAVAEGVPLKGKLTSVVVHPTPKPIDGVRSLSSAPAGGPIATVKGSLSRPVGGRGRQQQPVVSLESAKESLRSLKEARKLSAVSSSSQRVPRSLPPNTAPRGSVRQYATSPIQNNRSLQSKASARHSVIGHAIDEGTGAPLRRARSLESISSNRGDTIFHVIENEPPIPQRKSYASIVKGQLSNVQTQAIMFHPQISFGVPATQLSTEEILLPGSPPISFLYSGRFRPPAVTIRSPAGISTLSSQGFASMLPSETTLSDTDLSVATGLVMRDGHQYRFVIRKGGGRTETILKPVKS